MRNVYKGVESEESISHFKYIKKYRNTKGKWTYVYADKNTHKDIKKSINDFSKYNNASNATNDAALSSLYKKNAIDSLYKYDKALDKYGINTKVNTLNTRKWSVNVSNVLKAAYNAGTVTPSIYKETVKEATSFIEKLLGGTENYYAKEKKAKRPKPRKKKYTPGGSGVHLRK